MIDFVERICLLVDLFKNPYRWNTLFAYHTLLGSLIILFITFFPLFFFLRYLFKKRLTYNRVTTLSLTLSILCTIGVVAFSIWIIIMLSVLFNWEYGEYSYFLHPGIPLVYYLVFSISFSLWYWFRKKYKITNSKV